MSPVPTKSQFKVIVVVVVVVGVSHDAVANILPELFT
jgi:hypothetical protein